MFGPVLLIIGGLIAYLVIGTIVSALDLRYDPVGWGSGGFDPHDGDDILIAVVEAIGWPLVFLVTVGKFMGYLPFLGFRRLFLWVVGGESPLKTWTKYVQRKTS